MLIEKKDVAVGDVATLRLITGEEIIGKVTAISSASVTLTKPMSIQAHMGPNGQVGIGFAPVMVTVPEDGSFTFDIATKLLLAPMKTRQEVSAQYLQMTTGIVPASANSIIR